MSFKFNLPSSICPLDTILNKLQIKSPEAVYLLGSHLWGTARPDSDHDLIIVVKNYHGEHSLHLSQVDVTILDIKEFQQRVKKHEFLETICTLLPKEFRLIEKTQFKPLSSKEFNQTKWREIIMYRMQRDLAYSDKNEQKGKLMRASKTRFHAIVTLCLGIQVKNYYLKHTPIDFTIAKKYHSICGSVPENFNSCNVEPVPQSREAFLQIYHNLLQAFTLN